VVFNVSARQDNKRISERQALSILSFLGNHHVKTVVISAPEDKALGRHIVSNAKNVNCFYYPDAGMADLGEIAWLIEGATGVITPDTAIIHIASAVSTPVLGIFTPIQVNQEWLPYKVKYQLIKASEGQPVETISEEALISGLKKFLEIIPIIASTKETA
jgi:ADP-heptose:LPS heptosyltransferase